MAVVFLSYKVFASSYIVWTSLMFILYETVLTVMQCENNSEKIDNQDNN